MHIKQIIIKNFWQQENIVWELNSDVNVLIGINGAGKTCILNMVAEALSPKPDINLDFTLFSDFCEEMDIVLDNDDVISIDSNANTRKTSNSLMDISLLNCKLIQTFNTPITFFDKESLKALEPLLGYEIKTTLDFELGKYVRQFRDYKQSIDNEILAKVRKKETVYTAQLYEKVDKFYTLINDFFQHTNKTIDDSKEPFHFLPREISVKSLSSGEKQLFLLLLAAFLHDDKNAILLLDEPEISLHLSWQRGLIDSLRKLNNKCQLIIVTHSPTIYGENWIGSRQLLSEIKKPLETENQQIAIDVSENNLPNKTKELLHDLEQIINSLNITPTDVTYHVNIRLQKERRITIDLSRKVIKLMNEKKAKLDQITLGALLNRIDTFENGKKILSEIALKPNFLTPNSIALNQLVKKTFTLKESIVFIKENFSKENNFPDIITFSTIIGKTRTKDEIKEVESLRVYYEIKANQQYNEKLESLLKRN